MKFSWFHLPTFYQEFHGSASQFYQDMLEETDRAEALGFHMDYDKYLYPYRLIFGDPDQCAERLAQIRATGITNIGLIGNFGGLERGKILTSLDRFAKYVMPRFA